MSVANSLKNFVAPMVLVAAFAGVANDAHALDFGCRDKDQIKSELMAENQVPVVRFYQDAAANGASKSEWNENFFTMNPQTREGFRMSRNGNTQMCIMGKFTDVRLYNPQSLDQRAYLDSADADKKGTGINNLIYGSSVNRGENAMFRASEYSPISKDTRVTYVIANPLKGNEGAVFSASLEGKYIEKFTKKIPNAQSGHANVDHGAIFTPAGADVAAQQSAQSAPPKSVGSVASLDPQ